MSYQPQPGQQAAPAGMPPQQGQPPRGPVGPQGPQTPFAARSENEERADKVLEEVLGGQIPGAGYLFADDPEKRQEHMIKTTPEVTRDALLRAVEVCAQNATLPFGMVTKAELGKAALAFSQAYLLLDPSVDETGVPVGAQAIAQGEAQVAAAHAQGQAQSAVSAQQHAQQMEMEEHKADLEARVAAHESGQAFQRPVTVSGYVEPPRVLPNPAEAKLGEDHKAQEQELRGARGDVPRPKPRVG